MVNAHMCGSTEEASFNTHRTGVDSELMKRKGTLLRCAAQLPCSIKQFYFESLQRGTCVEHWRNKSMTRASEFDFISSITRWSVRILKLYKRLAPTCSFPYHSGLLA
jgi:hypothetical protein